MSSLLVKSKYIIFYCTGIVTLTHKVQIVMQHLCIVLKSVKGITKTVEPEVNSHYFDCSQLPTVGPFNHQEFE